MNEPMNEPIKNPIMKVIRPLIYIGAFVVLCVAIVIKKDIIIEKRAVEAVSIPNEVRKHGWPVDVKKMERTALTSSTSVTVNRTGSFTGAFFAAEDLRRKVTVGTPVYEIPSKASLGRVTSVPSSRDMQTGLYRITVQFHHDSDVEKKFAKDPNLTVALQLKAKNNVLTVPIDAISRDDSGASYVWTLNNEMLPQKRPVQIGLRSTEEVEVTKGLSPDELIIVEGQNGLAESTKVRVRKTVESEGSRKKEVML